ncbi:MAG: hydroxyacylglutathione hydrolase [Alphaproteobacteria bacterium]|nr:hydroxyacylglutathione hydrolase [Alphaproteobacteria bacterium]
MLQIHQFPCLDDNYGFLVHDPETGATAAIDTPDADVYLAEAARKGWRITDIWNTHWHPDHAGGNAAIKAATGAVVSGPAEVARIGVAPDRVLQGGDEARLGGRVARVLDVGGHTLGHIAYVFDADHAAFVGDALFALGCGRMFEGDPVQFWASLSRLAALPDETVVYCAHEYTASNAKFALHVDGANPALVAYADEVARKRAAGQPTVPTTIGAERAANPFLRAPALKAGLGLADDAEAFATLRRMKDTFK